jgi:hypothetical protein
MCSIARLRGKIKIATGKRNAESIEDNMVKILNTIASTLGKIVNKNLK